MARLTHTTALILQAVASGYRYGFDVMQATGLPSGTVYPALRRMEDRELLRSRWEREQDAQRDQRPARKYYEVRPAGLRALAEAVKRYRHLANLVPASAESAPTEA